MDGKERVIKHLEITQGVINRLANNSFLIKNWSMAILAAAMLFLVRVESVNSVYLTLSFTIPVISFWILDGYFLWQERLFRGIYNDIRTLDDSDFKMDISVQLKKPKSSWPSAIFSTTLTIFYFTELSFLALITLIMSCQ